MVAAPPGSLVPGSIQKSGFETASATTPQQATVTELLDALATNLSNISGRTISLLEAVFGPEETPPLDESLAAGLPAKIESLIDAARVISERLERLSRAL